MFPLYTFCNFVSAMSLECRFISICDCTRLYHMVRITLSIVVELFEKNEREHSYKSIFIDIVLLVLFGAFV